MRSSRIQPMSSLATSTYSARSSSSSLPLWLLGAGAATAIAAGAALDPDSRAYLLPRSAYACGILGYVSKKDPAVDFLLEGITILQNRGYDSAGIATIDPASGEVLVTKFASQGTTSDCIEILKSKAPAKHGKHQVGIAHTRWATHGGKTDENAHPHTDSKNRVALCHNGTIENSAELKEELLAKGITFKSQTDTEVIVQLIGYYMDQGQSFDEALKTTLGRLEGTWGLVIIAKEKPNQIIVTRHGSPMIVGLGDGEMFVASEPSAFNRHTAQYIELVDDEVAVITSEGMNLDISRIKQAHKEDIQLSPAPYKHWTIKEISEQPESIARALNYGGRFESDTTVRLGGLEESREMLLKIEHLILSGCGTSLYASQYGAALMRWLGAFRTVQTVDAAEVDALSFPSPHEKAGILVLSQSGETRDVIDAIQIAESLGIPRFSMVNAVGSFIARTTKCGVYLNAGREHAVASTKAFTNQVTVAGLVAAWFSQNRQFGEANDFFLARRKKLIDALHRLPIYVGMILHDRLAIKAIAEKIKDAKHMFLLGKGFSEPIAYEGALKIKEITYIHAEGYSGGALKHGPFALIEPGIPIIMVILDDEHASMMRTAAEEVRARGARTIIITDNPKLAQGVSDDWIYVPSNGPLTALLAIIPIQILAYELSIAKGIDPDKPRHLAKAVTTR